MMKTWRDSKRLQGFFIILAAAASVLPLVAEHRQDNSIRWTVTGDRIECEYFRVPSYSHVKTYDRSALRGVTGAPSSATPEVSVVRLHMSGLNLNLPWQSSERIWNFDTYLEELRTFIGQVHAGNGAATFTWFHPWLVVGAVSVPVAAALWVAVFAVLLLRPKPVEAPISDQQR
jgi:hypothetical protein